MVIGIGGGYSIGLTVNDDFWEGIDSTAFGQLSFTMKLGVVSKSMI